jgi:hypothetical protein
LVKIDKEIIYCMPEATTNMMIPPDDSWWQDCPNHDTKSITAPGSKFKCPVQLRHIKDNFREFPASSPTSYYSFSKRSWIKDSD